MRNHCSLSNIITLLRLRCAPLVIWLVLEDHLVAAFWVFILAGISDGVDGFIAKTFDLRSLLGAYIDPLADKALLVSIYVSLGLKGYIPDWLVILVVFRDAVIVGGLILEHMLRDHVVMKPLLISKANTLLQITLAGFVLAKLGGYIDAGVWLSVLIYMVAATTLASGALYVWNGLMGIDKAGGPV